MILFTGWLAATDADGWRPGIGDPTFMGWLTVAAYFAAALLCYRAFRRTSNESGMARTFWSGLAALFVVLGFNKQLDLQSLFTQIGRDLARQGDWYGSRQAVQTVFIISLAAVGLFTIGWLCWIMRRSMKSHGLALIGTVFIITFVVIRAASFHHVDAFLGWDVLGFEMNWAMELAGIACVGIGAVRVKRGIRPAASRIEMTGEVLPRVDADLIGSTSISNQRESFRWMVERLRARN